jgi:transposase
MEDAGNIVCDPDLPRPDLSRFLSDSDDKKLKKDEATGGENCEETTGENCKDKQQEIGYTFAIQKLSEMIGLTSILKKSFPDKWKEILTIAMYMCAEGNVMKDIVQWFEESRITLLDEISDTMCSNIFASISFFEMMQFFKYWIQLRLETDYLIFDVTSISSYSENIDQLSKGYNRDGENLKQINIGLFYGHSSRLPIYYSNYDGSITDVTSLPYMITESSKLGIQDVTFLLDRGFLSKSNLIFMHDNNYFFIIPMQADRSYTKSIIDQYASSVKDPDNWIKKFQVYGTKISGEVLYGIPVNIFIYYDYDKAKVEESDVYEKIDKQEIELSKLNKNKLIGSSYKRFFDIEQNPTVIDITYKKNREKILKEINRCGYFLFVTNKDISDAETMMSTYKTRDEIEKNFDNFKNDLFFNRLKTHPNKTTDGKLFVGFIALILRTALLHKTKNNEDTKKLCLKDIIRKLKLIKVTTINNEPNIKLPYSKLQKDIYAAIGVLLDELIKSI